MKQCNCLLNNELIRSYNDLEYLYFLIAYYAAPTIGNIKPSSLVSFKNSSRNNNEIWHRYKKTLKNNINHNYIELFNKDKLTVVLFYNEKILTKILKNKENINFLYQYGYNENMSLDECLKHLSKRYNNGCPHEIGIFLGYPLKDVKAFTSCCKKECLMVGYWKVYSDVKTAKKAFKSYDLIKNKVLQLLSTGTNPTQLFSMT